MKYLYRSEMRGFMKHIQEYNLINHDGKNDFNNNIAKYVLD